MAADAADPYAYPGTDVLRNKAGIRDPIKLERFEYEQSYARAREIRELPVQP